MKCRISPKILLPKAYYKFYQEQVKTLTREEAFDITLEKMEQDTKFNTASWDNNLLVSSKPKDLKRTVIAEAILKSVSVVYNLANQEVKNKSLVQAINKIPIIGIKKEPVGLFKLTDEEFKSLIDTKLFNELPLEVKFQLGYDPKNQESVSKARDAFTMFQTFYNSFLKNQEAIINTNGNTYPFDSKYDTIYNFNTLLTDNGSKTYIKFNEMPERIQLAAFKVAIEWLVNTNKRDNDFNTVKESFLNISPNATMPQNVFNLFKDVGSLRQVAERKLGNELINILGIEATQEMLEINPFYNEIMSNSLGQYAMRLLIDRGGILNNLQLPTDVGHLSAYFKDKNKNKDILGDYGQGKDHFKHFVQVTEEGKAFIEKLQKAYTKKPAYVDMSNSLFGFNNLNRVFTKATSVNKESPNVQLNDFNTGVNEAIEAINYHNENPHLVNMSLYNITSKITKEGLKKLLGYQTTDRVINVRKETVDGQNVSIDTAVETYYEYLELYKALDKSNDFTTRIYLKFRLWMMGRIGALPGTINPQTTKLHRHGFLSESFTREIDPNNQTQLELFKIGIASLVAEEINKASKEEHIANFDKFYSDNKHTLKALKKALGKTNSEKEIESLLTTLKVDSEAKLDGIAQLLEYNETEKFTASVIAEIDATTSGTTIGGLIATHKSMDIFGRLGVSNIGQRLLDYKKSALDTYEQVAANIPHHFNIIFKDKPQMLEALNKLISGFLDTDGERPNKTQRDFAKSLVNPVQYGGGLEPITNNMTDYILEKVYKQLEDIWNSKDSTEVKNTKAKELGRNLDIIIEKKGIFESKFSNLETFAIEGYISDYEIGTIRNALEEVSNSIFIDVNEILGDISAARQQVIQAVNGMNYMMIYAFNQMVDRKKAETGKDLTNKERKDILKQLQAIRPLMPSIYTGEDTTRFIDNTDYERSATGDIALFTTEKGKDENLNTPVAASKVRPKNKNYFTKNNGQIEPRIYDQYDNEINVIQFIEPSGVSARPGPFFIQSIDASAMYAITLMAKEAGIRFYPIHDAVLFSIFDLQQMSDITNKAYMDLAFKHNPLQKMVDHFDSYYKNIDKFFIDNKLEGKPSELLLNKTTKELAVLVNHKGRKGDTSTFAELRNGIEDIANKHQEFVDNVLSAQDLTVDIFAQPLKPLTIKATKKTDTDYQRIGESSYPSIDKNKELATKIKEELQRLFPKVSVKYLDKVFDNLGNEVLGKAIEAAIDVSKKAKLDTLPHEYAHIYVNLMNLHPLLNKVLKKIQTLDKLNEEQSKETLVKILGMKFVDLQANKELSKYGSIAKNVWKTIVKFFSTASFKKAMRDYKAREALEKEIDNVFNNFTSGDVNELINFSPKPGHERVVFDEALAEEDFGRELIINLTKKIDGLVLTGSLALAPFINIYRKKGNLLHDLDFVIDSTKSKGNEFKILMDEYPGSVQSYGDPDQNPDYKIITYAVAPKGYKIDNIQRFKGFARIISYDIVDGKGNVVNTYNAKVSQPDPKKAATDIVEESFTNPNGVKAKYVDFINGQRSPLNYYSSLLDTKIKLSRYQDVFIGKYDIGMRSKDILDYTLAGEATTQKAITKAIRSLGSSQESNFKNQLPVNSEKVSKDTLETIFNRLGTLDQGRDSQEHTDALRRVLSLIGERIGGREFNLEQYAFKNKSFGLIEDLNIKINQALDPVFTALNMSQQEIYTHELTHAIIRNGIEKNTFLRNRLKELFDQAKEIITVEDFLVKNPDGSIRIVQDEVTERAEAQKRYEYIFNNPTKEKNIGLHEFATFALTNAQFKEALSKQTREKKTKEVNNLVEKVFNWFTDLMVGLYNRYTGKTNLPMNEEIFKIAYSISKINVTAQNTVLGKLSIGLDYSNAAVRAGFKKVGDWSKKPNPNRLQRYIRVASNLGTITEHEKFKYALAYIQDKAVESERQVFIQLAKFFAHIPTEMKGMSDDLYAFNMFIGEQKNKVDGEAQERKTAAAKEVVEAYNEELSDNEKQAIYRTILKTGLDILGLSLPELSDLLKDPNKLKAEIKAVSDSLSSTGKYKNRYIKYAKALGYYMITKRMAVRRLQLNAHNIVDQVFTGNPIKIKNREQALVNIDKLKTLYALSFVRKELRELTADVIDREHFANSEVNGITFTLDWISQFREKSLRDLFNNDPTQMQAGYDAELINSNVDRIFSEIENDEELIKRGYKMVSPLKQDTADLSNQRYMYINNWGGKETYTAGGIGLTDNHSFGTDLLPNEYNEDLIEEQTLADMENPDIDTEADYLLPKVNENQKIVGYRYVMTETDREKYLEKDTNFINNLANMEDHYVRKISTEVMNKEGINLLYDDYQKNFGKNPQIYIEISNTGKYKEIYKMMPYSTREYMKQKFNGRIFVRSDLLLIMFGSRDLSISNFKFGKDDGQPSRLDKNWVRIAERVTREIVKHLKARWVMLTPVFINNIWSNIYTAFLHNIPMDYWIKKNSEGAYAANDYVAKKKEMLRLEIRLESTKKRLSPNSKAALEKKIQELQQDLEANPLHKYVDMGFLTTIVDDIDIQEELETHGLKNKAAEFFDKKIGSKLPKTLKTIWKYAYVTPDTPIFRGLHKATQFSDLAAKYAMVEYYTKEKGMLEKEAIKLAIDTFIQYNSVTSPLLKYGNDIGVTPFTKYRMRIQKVNWQMLAKNPVNFMLMTALDKIINIPNIAQGMDLVPIGLATPFDYFEHGAGFPILNVTDNTLSSLL